ncbi:MAG: DNA-3-methyladenine glycosylase [Candidatus Obscuribacterales bacterium]|nr:DNA-3-methyladenine glycosylase [Candidatus Obscuribacterales bacterium]
MKKRAKTISGQGALDGIEDSDFLLSYEFFQGSTLDTARNLLGRRLWRKLPDGSVLHGPIVEVEAYTEDDPACHAYRGETPRCRVLFGPPGHAYIYFIYGMYHCLNLVTEPEGKAGAVLIRAVGAEGTNGPGRLCRQWSIDKSLNGVDMTRSDSPIWLSRGSRVADSDVETTARIGLSVAVDRLWRFAVKDHASVSGPAKVIPRIRKKRNASSDGGRGAGK